jgi:hypothetical protein
VIQNLDDGKETDVLIMDFSKAFDKVSHNLLMHQQEHYGIRGMINNWMESVLSGRTQAVIVEGEQSTYLPVDSGVPQGSTLGPSLFLYYINDIATGLDSTIRLFVDDTIAYLVIKSNSDALTLQRDLDKLAQWEQLWKMAFHPDKCNVLTISRNTTPKKFKYCLHDHVLESVDKVNNMGVTISDDLKWESHINNICGKANKTLGFLRRNLNIGSTSVKAQACKSLVRPSLEYACSVRDSHLKSDINKI